MKDGNKSKILMRNMKDDYFGSKQLEFTYNEANCLIHNERSYNPFNPNPAEMYFGEELVANWKIYVQEKKVVVNILDINYIEDEFLILGLFHAYLYATKG